MVAAASSTYGSLNLQSSNVLSPLYESSWSEVWHVPIDPSQGDFRLEQIYPSYSALFPFEYEFSWADGPLWTLTKRRFWWASWAACALYLVAIYFGQKAMASREAFSLKKPLAAWNLLLAVFSWVGAVRMLPHLAYGLATNHPLYFVCRTASPAYGTGPAGLWVGLFMWSKYFELLDTAFLVLRKKPVTFLHWFHHATVLLYCWQAGQFESSTGIFFACMNYVVHGVMYFYYFLAAVGRPPRWGLFVTVIQIAQMFAGMFITAVHYFSLEAVPNCDGSMSTLTAAFLMYTAYMMLFVQFFVTRYCGSRAKKPKTKAE